MPGTTSALPQVPAVSSTTIATEFWYHPPIAQLPTEPQETEATPAVSTFPVPWTSSALPQVPAVSLTTNSDPVLPAFTKLPAAEQLPADAQESEATWHSRRR